MSQISIDHLTFQYDGSFEPILENVSVSIDTDWKLGFIGRNGRGKTTLLNLLMGKYEYQGTISSSVEFSYFPYAVDNPSRITLDIAQTRFPQLEEWQLARELNCIEMSEDVLFRRFDTLSSGEQTKILLALLFSQEDRFLLIDEPTNHLDLQARQAVARYLYSKSGFILVSHDRAFLDHCVDHILSINKANIELQRGNYSSWRENKDRQDQFETAQYKKLQKQANQLSEAAKRTANWSIAAEQEKKGSRNGGPKPDRGYLGHKAAKMMKRAKSIESRREEAYEQKTKLLKNVEESDSLAIYPLRHPKDLLVQARDLTVFYGDNLIFSSKSFELHNGDRLAISGKNGSGKSSILKLIAGQDVPHSGMLHLASGLKISYVSQETSDLSGSLMDFAQDNSIDTTLFFTILRKLDFSRSQFEKPIETYSEGQKKKVLLARSMCQRAHLYLWDEPLNFVDILSRVQLEDLLIQYNPTMIFIEHDQVFRDKIASKILELG